MRLAAKGLATTSLQIVNRDMGVTLDQGNWQGCLKNFKAWNISLVHFPNHKRSDNSQHAKTLMSESSRQESVFSYTRK